jgi:hypothetical protein
MTDEKQARLEARARIDIRKLYEKGEITLKDHASAIGYLRGVWFDHLSDAEIEDFICKEIRKLEPSVINPAEHAGAQVGSLTMVGHLVRDKLMRRGWRPTS